MKDVKKVYFERENKSKGQDFDLFLRKGMGLEYTPTFDEVQLAVHMFKKHKKLMKKELFTIGFSLVILLSLFDFFYMQNRAFYLPIFVVVSLAVIAFVWIMPIVRRRMLADALSVDVKYHVCIYDDRILIGEPFTPRCVYFNHPLVQIIETEGQYTIYSAEGKFFYIIPKRIIAGIEVLEKKMDSVKTEVRKDKIRFGRKV